MNIIYPVYFREVSKTIIRKNMNILYIEQMFLFEQLKIHNITGSSLQILLFAEGFFKVTLWLEHRRRIYWKLGGFWRITFLFCLRTFNVPRRVWWDINLSESRLENSIKRNNKYFCLFRALIVMWAPYVAKRESLVPKNASFPLIWILMNTLLGLSWFYSVLLR